MKSLLAEFDILMNVGGFTRVGEIDSNAIGKLRNPLAVEGGLTLW